jgi:RNA polymerase sigma-70 factor (ECF subfamily)
MPDPQEERSSFLLFARSVEPGLRAALVSFHGAQAGMEATNDALVYAWSHWDRVRSMRNPAGYLYRVGQRAGRRPRMKRPVPQPSAVPIATPWVEPGLQDALESLTRRQRQVVVLIEGYEWTQAEVAELLGISKSAVQTHLERGLHWLREALGVGYD